MRLKRLTSFVSTSLPSALIGKDIKPSKIYVATKSLRKKKLVSRLLIHVAQQMFGVDDPASGYEDLLFFVYIETKDLY